MKALRSLPPYIQLHIVEQELHRHLYGNGKVCIHAVHKRTTHLPNLQVPDLDRNHTHLKHLPPKPEPHKTPDWVGEDAPYISHDRAYHYPSPSNTSPEYSATQTAERTSKSSKRH